MKIVFMGTPDFAVTTLQKLYDSPEHEVSAVFTQTDKPRGRGNKFMPTPVKKLALEHNTPVYQPQSLKNQIDEYLPVLKELNPDCIVVAAYGKLLPKQVLELPKYGCVNVHGSILPEYRGAAPIQRAVLDGKNETGVTTMLMGEQMDAGDILLVSKTAIGENETSAELFDRLAVMGADLLVNTLEKLEKGEITPMPQDESKVTFAQMITKDMAKIDFSQSAEQVHRLICGLSDSPCAVTFMDGKRLKIYHSKVVDTESDNHKAGEIADSKKFIVACGKGRIEFTEIQLEGSKRLSANDFLRGHSISEGDILG